MSRAGHTLKKKSVCPDFCGYSKFINKINEYYPVHEKEETVRAWKQ